MPQARSSLKISTFLIYSHFGGWRPLKKLEWSQFYQNYSQIYTEGTVRTSNLYLADVRSKLGQRSPGIFKVTYKSCDTSFLTKFSHIIGISCLLGHAR